MRSPLGGSQGRPYHFGGGQITGKAILKYWHHIPFQLINLEESLCGVEIRASKCENEQRIIALSIDRERREV